MTRPDPEQEQLVNAVSALREAYAAAVAAIEATPEHQTAFEQATVLREVLDELVGLAAELRARMVERIWKTEELSLAALAQRIGVSKSRADQFIQTARASHEKETEK